MDEEVRDLLRRTLKDIVTLEVTLFFHGHPETIDSREGLTQRLEQEPAKMTQALENLAQAGIVNRYELGEGRYEVYSLTHDAGMRSKIDRLNTYYHEDPASRAEIIQHIISSSIRMPGAETMAAKRKLAEK
jgi:hypothetical protein